MSEITELKIEALPDLDDLLQCPVCYEIPSGQIFQCNEGHHVCGRCKARLNQCPVCRAFFFGTRNYAMEELIANIKKVQAGKLGRTQVTTCSAGSESTVSADNSIAGATLDGSLEEESNNDFPRPNTLQTPTSCKGLFRCLCCKNGSTERLPAARLLNHLRYFHSPELIEGKSEEGEYIQAWQIATTPGRIVIAVRVSDMGVFFLVIEISEQKVYSWVSMASAPWVANAFCYTITITGNDREAFFTDSVWSVRSCEGALKKRGRCLVVSGSDVRALTASSMVSGRLTLRRAPLDQDPHQAQPRAVLRVANRGAGDTQEHQDEDTVGLEPFLQDLHEDVARLSRAFATLGREADALARTEAEVRAQLNTDNRARAVAVPVAPPPVPVHEVNQDEGARLSRNARRRLRRRLNDAIRSFDHQEPTSFITEPAPPHSQPPFLPCINVMLDRAIASRSTALTSGAPPLVFREPVPPPAAQPVPPSNTANGVPGSASRGQGQENRRRRRQRR